VVDFDVQVSTDTAAEADALKAQVKGSDAAEASAVLADFKTELAVVATSGDFADVPANFAVPAQLAVATEQAVAGLETGAPTPAPAGADGGSPLPIGAIVGAAVAVAAIAAFAVLRSKLTQAAAAATSMAPSDHGVGGIQMADIYPQAGGVEGGIGGGDDGSGGDGHHDVLFGEGPLGLAICNIDNDPESSSDVEVTRVTGQAEELGVQVGDVFASISGECMRGKPQHEITAALRAGEQPLATAEPDTPVESQTAVL
jgi:hypothetical protein